MGTSGAFTVWLHGTVLFKESLHAHLWSLLHWFCLLFVVLTIQSCCSPTSAKFWVVAWCAQLPFRSDALDSSLVCMPVTTASHHSSPILYWAPEFSCRLDLYSQPPCSHGKLIGWLVAIHTFLVFNNWLLAKGMNMILSKSYGILTPDLTNFMSSRIFWISTMVHLTFLF